MNNLTDIIKKVINEQGEKKILPKSSITTFNLKKFSAQGLTPYYFDFKVNGDFKIISVEKPTSNKEEHTRVYLLTSDEYEKVSKMIDGFNNLVKMKLEQIELYKEYILSSVVEKIMS